MAQTQVSAIAVPMVQISSVEATAGLPSGIVVISNRSPHAILALAGAWTYTDSAARRKRSIHRCDRFLPVGTGRVIVPPESAVYLGSDNCVAVQTPAPRLSRLFRGREPGTTTHISINAVLFDNGDMYAPDSSYADDIQARVSAAHEVAARFREAILQGQSRDEILATFVPQARKRAHGESVWLQNFANTLVSMNDRFVEGYLRGLEQIPMPSIILRSTSVTEA